MSLPRLLPLLFALCLGFALAKSYTLESVTQEVYFRADGTVRVEDTRTLRMDGDFSDNTYFVEVDPAPGGSVRFEGARALDGKTPARATINGNEIAWKVHARNETRTFRFSYVLTGEMQVAQDAARFARDVLEPEHAPVGSYRLVLHTPAPSPNQFKVFIFTGRGRIGTLDVAADGSKATVTLPALSADEDVLAVVLLDASVFRVQNVSGSKLGDWLAELGNSTEAFRRASERQLAEAQDASPLWALPAVAIALAVFIWFWRSYRAFGREPPTQDIGPYYREPAEEIPPAVVPFVLTQSPPGTSAAGPAVAATLLDFARRGYLQLQTVTSDGFLGLGNSEKVYYQIVREPKDLPGFEAELWQAFEGAALKADKVSLVGLFQSFRGQDKTPNASSRVFDADDLRDYFKNHPSFAQDWVKEPRDWYERTHGRLLDPDASRRSLPITILAGLLAVLTLFGAFVAFALGALLGAIVLACGLLLIGTAVASAVALKRWQPDKLLNAKKWEAYKRFLSDFSMMRQAPAEHYKLWDYHFVYATALGVSKDYLKNLRRLMETEPDRFVIPTWIALHPGLGPSSTPSNLDALTGSLNTLSQIETNLNDLSSALSPKTSTGGGFGGSSGGFSGGFSGGGGSSGMR